ncbi:MAG: hypothetical protein AAFY25_08635 [Pseudomonadota bacterium]
MAFMTPGRGERAGMMALRLDLERDEAEDALTAEIAHKADLFRAAGRIGDLIRLRDARLRAGLAQAKAGLLSAARHTARTTARHTACPGIQSRVAQDGPVPEMDLSTPDPLALQSALELHGVALLRNAVPVRRTLELRRMFEAALLAGQTLHQLELDDLPDIRHTDSKEMFYPVPEKIDLPSSVARAYLGDLNILNTFMSPRISFEWLDDLTAQGVKALLQVLLQDEVRFRCDTCLIRRSRSADPSPDWSHAPGGSGGGVMLWMPLHDCGEGTERAGLDIRMQGPAPFAGQPRPMARPFFAAGDALMIANSNLISMPSEAKFTQETIAIETSFIARSRCAPQDLPVFW